MKKILLFITLFCGFSCLLYSQEKNEDGVVSFSLPIRNSLKFNRYLINPTFSFVREANPYVSFYNKRQWTQFDDAPNTYLFNYSGLFGENEAFAAKLGVDAAHHLGGIAVGLVIPFIAGSGFTRFDGCFGILRHSTSTRTTG